MTQVAFVLEAVVTQQLILHSSGKGRVLVPEILLATQAIKAVIREGKLHQIYTLMQAGQKFGMQTMNQALVQACASRKISHKEAASRSQDPKEFEQILGRFGAPV